MPSTSTCRPLEVLLQDAFLRAHLLQEAGGAQGSNLLDQVDEGGADVRGQAVLELVTQGQEVVGQEHAVVVVQR